MENYIIIALLFIAIILEIVLLLKRSAKQDTLESEARIRQEISQSRMETVKEIRDTNEKISRGSSEINEQNLKFQNEFQDKLFSRLSSQSESINQTVSKSIETLQKSNEQKLDQMRETVDEKLTSTLTKRLDSSFQTVGEQLKAVHESVGEMKKIAGDVGDLQRVLTNVKARGTWAEVQLGNILEQTLTADKFERNVSIKNNLERVEFAIKIPSRTNEGETVWLPIDSKFPQEDYLRICDAAERADMQGVEEATRALERRIKAQAKDIHDLYIDVPKTTDFAIMFLPTEGLYAEVLRRPGLSEELQTKYHIMVCGPTTITAFLNTLQMGFKTIAIDKRASEVWEMLGAVKTQYDTFKGVLAKAKRKIEEAGTALEDAQKRNNIIFKKLKGVEEIETPNAVSLLGLDSESSDFESEDEE